MVKSVPGCKMSQNKGDASSQHKNNKRDKISPGCNNAHKGTMQQNTETTHTGSKEGPETSEKNIH